MQISFIKKPFAFEDPYNPGNIVKGNLIIDNADRIYGDLIITEVNGWSCEQYINCTPKFKYPGGTNSPYNRKPLMESYGIIYEKMDGSNIFRYVYKDKEGKQYATFKTRLTPYLKANQFNNFIDLWNIVLKKFPQINDLPMDKGYSFEMYGALNKIVIPYEVPISTVLLFVVDEMGFLYPPLDEYVFTNPAQFLPNIPHVKAFTNFEPVNDAKYAEYMDLVETQYVKNKNTEGVMFYIPSPKDGYTVYKCKPLKEDISGWLAYKCKSLSLLNDSHELDQNKQCDPNIFTYSEIITVVKNAWESCDDPAHLLDEVLALFTETESEEKIAANKNKIMGIVEQEIRTLAFSDAVVDLYKELRIRGLPSITLDKGTIMRTLIKEHPDYKKESTKVYTAILKYIAIKGDVY